MSRIVSVLMLILTTWLLLPPAQAETIQVPEDFEILQEAVDAAQDLDTVLVDPGDYERIIITNKDQLTLIGAGLDRLPHSTIHGLPETRTEVALKLEDCSEIEITGFEFVDGYSALWLQNSLGVKIHHNLIHELPDWWASSISVDNSSEVLIERNVMLRSWHYGLFITNNSQDITVCHNVIGLMVNNEGIHVDRASNVNIYNNIVFSNGDYGIYLTNNARNCRIEYNDLYQNRTGNFGNFNLSRTNIQADPDFIDPDEGLFWLDWGSPCIDTGDPEAPDDPDGTRADIGVYCFQQDGGAPLLIVDPEEIVGGGDSEQVLNICNEGEGLLRWLVRCDEDWVEIENPRGENEADEDCDIFLYLNDEGLEPDVYETVLQVLSNDPENRNLEIPVTMTLEQNFDEFEIVFEQGWNLNSFNFEPAPVYWVNEDQLAVELLFEQFRIDENNHLVRIVKDEVGRFYVPRHEFCNIPSWELDHGYMVKVQEPVVGTWLGIPIPADREIRLHEGWNIIPYYPDYQLAARAPEFYVLNPIIDQVQFAKDGVGHFMVPRLEFSNMDPWRPTQGYLVNMAEDVRLRYPEEDVDQLHRNQPVAVACSNHLRQDQIRTSENMSLLIVANAGLDIRDGDQILARTSAGKLIGTGVFAERRCGLSLWGDDSSTPIIDGLVTGEIPTFRLNRDGTEIPISINLFEGKLAYRTNSFAYGAVEMGK